MKLDIPTLGTGSARRLSDLHAPRLQVWCRNIKAIYAWTLAAVGIALAAGCGSSGLANPSTAGVSPSVGSPAPQSIYVAWRPHPDPTVTGYMIYYGPSIDTATTVASNQPIDSPGFDPLAPLVSYNPATDLGLHAGDTVCFRLKAYNPDGESGFSPGICTAI